MPITRPTVNFINERGVRDGSSPAETYAPNGSSVTAKFHVPFSQRNSAVLSFVGYSQLTYDGTEPNGLERLTPRSHPDASFMYATSIPSITHHKWTGGTNGSLPNEKRNVFSKSEITVAYEFLPYNVSEDTEIEYEWERYTYVRAVKPGVDYLKMPAGCMKYVDHDSGEDFGAIPFGPGMVVPITEIEVTWVDLPFAIYNLSTPTPWQKRIWGDGTNRPWLGTVNKYTMWGVPPGSALFSNIQMEPKRSPFTGMAWDITFTFSIHSSPRGWNSAYYFPVSLDSSYTAGWYYISGNVQSDWPYRAPGSVPDGESLYNERDLLGRSEAGLFDVGA